MKTNEKGRSMIEMLGVLAIIGVLSVGGIAGYSKAMTKYRVNKTIDTVSMTMANVRTLFGTQKSYDALGNTYTLTEAQQNLIAKTRLLPDELISGNTVPNGSNAFGGDISLYSAKRNTADDAKDKAFVIRITGVTESACMELATQDWGSSAGSGLIAFSVTDSSTASTEEAGAAAKYLGCTDKGAVQCGGQGPMSVTAATEACADNAVLTWKFY